MIPIHILTTHFFIIQFNIILALVERSPKSFTTYRFSVKNFAHIICLSHKCYIPSPSNYPQVDQPNNTSYLAKNTNYEIPYYILFTLFHYFLSLRSKYSPLQPVLRHPQCIPVCASLGRQS
jgi:hypothetical protein